MKKGPDDIKAHDVLILKAYSPATYDDPDILAVKALSQGKASESQQKRALDWIITKASRYYDISYRPESSRDTDFAEGRRFVGAQIVKLLKTPIKGGNL